MSETLREQEGYKEVAEEEDARDDPDQVFRAHSRSTALRMSRETRRNRAIKPR